MTSTMAHYDIFRHHLSIAAPAYGHALWEPSPGNLYPAVEVGDVGYIRQGKFHRLFNVLLPANDPSHGNFGVPEYHEPLTVNIENHIDVGTLRPHNFFSIGVTLGPESDRYQSDGPNTEGDFSFSCPMNQGAVLCLPIAAKREDTIASTKFGKWMMRHIDRWFAWARELELGVDRMEDIILVTGTHRTRSCVNVAFPGGQRNAEISFRAIVDSPGDIVAINWQFSHEHNRGAFLNCGPEGEDLPEDQCIFVRGFRVTRKFRIFPRLKGAAGPNPDPKGYDEGPDMELISVPAVPEYRDPLHILMQFIAEEAPNCDMVLVHDNDLADHRGVYDGAPIESLQPDAIFSRLRSAKLKIHEVSFDSDLSFADNGGSADTETGRIATLSDLFSEFSAPSTSLPQSHYHVETTLPRIERALPNDTVLHLAIQENDLDIVKLLLEQGADANATNIQELTPLHGAAYGGQLDLMRMLLLHDASVGARDKNGETALHFAARKNHPEMATLLLEHGAEADARNIQELSPLYCAVYEGHAEVTRVLLRCGADVEARYKNGETALHLAAWKNQSEIAELLLDHGANANIKNIQGLMPLYCATHEGKMDVTRVLLRCGADVGAQDMNGETALHLAARKNRSEMVPLLLEHGADMNAKNIQELTPLYCAAYERQAEVMRVLLRHGANVEARDKNGVTALHLTAWYNDSEIAAMLLEHGANVDAQNIQELTPLYYAAQEGKLEVMRVLLRYGADIEARDKNGETALHLAARNNHSEMTTLLLERGANANAKDLRELTPLYCAVYAGHLQVMRVLLLHGVDIEARTPMGRTVLHLAAQTNRSEMATLLHEHGSDANARDVHQLTPLHFAAQEGKTEVMHVLFLHGADVNSRDECGKTALHLAVPKQNLETVELLLKHGADANAGDDKGRTVLDTALLWRPGGDVIKLLSTYGATGQNRDLGSGSGH